jgi:hypothetical protein
MQSRLKILVTMSLSLTIAVTYAAVLMSQSNVESNDLKGNGDPVLMFRICIPNEPSVGDAADVALCVQEALLAAGDRVAEVHKAAEVAASRDPWFADACHLGSHEAGHDLARKAGAVKALSLVSNMCSSGLIHGIFDAVGADLSSKQNWKLLAETCINLRSRGPAACPDGMGHAAWDATGDATAAEEICTLFTDSSARSECSEGVVMQRFEPATEGVNRARDLRPADPTKICRSRSDASILDGCYRGIGWLLANDLAAKADAVGALRGSVSEKAIPLLVDVFRSGLNTCKDLGAGERACTHRLLTSVPVALFRDRETRSALCGGDENVRLRCEEIAGMYVGVNPS